MARRLGWQDYEQHERWLVLRRRRGMRADFGDEVLSAFFRPDLWAIAEALIRDGPVIAAARAFEALHLMAERGVSANRRRGAGPPSLPYLRMTRLAFHRLFDNLVALRHAQLAHELLEPWDHAPRIELPDLPDGGYDVQAPPPHLVRAKLDELTREIRLRLRVAPTATYAEEAHAIATAPPRFAVGLWNPLQRRMLLGLYTVLGGRKEAMRLLRRSDFIPDYRFAEGGTGPVLKLRPRKRAGRWLVRVKRLHPELAAMISNYLAFVDRKIQLAYDDPAALRRQGRPRPSARKMPPDAPLIPISLNDWRPLDSRTPFSGRTRRDAATGKWVGRSYALIPRLGALPDDMPEEVRPCVGYTPHEFRHLAFQLAVRAGVLYNERNLGSGAEAWARPELYGHATLDHGNPSDLSELYGDFGNELAVEMLTARAIHGSWELLATEAGARRRPDLPAYVRARDALRLLEARLERLARRAATLAEATDKPAPTTGDGVHAKLDRVIRELEALRELTLEGHAVTHEILRLTEQRAILVERVAALRFDTRTWLPIPDTEPPPPQPDWEEVDAAIRTGRLTAASFREPPRAVGRHAQGAPLPFRPRWTEELIRTELEDLLAGLTTWPRFADFRAAGKPRLYRALLAHGGHEYWAAEFGFRHVPRFRRNRRS